MIVTIADDVVELEVRIAARPETIFAFLIEPEKMKQWLGIEVAADPRPGGVFRVSISKDSVVSGQYVEVRPYSRVVFTWGGGKVGDLIPPGASTVEFTLTPDGDGTVVRLRHLGLPSEEQQSHGQGWEHFLPRLVEVAEGREPGPDPWAGSTD